MSATGTVLRNAVKKERPAPVTRTAQKRNAAGHDLGTVDLEPTVFGLEPNRAVLHQVITAQLAGVRAGTQSTRTRAEVRGGGAKPFRQKGTGRARQGSSRSPSMSGGGVALGPKPRSYAQRTPKKMVRLALLSALSDRAEVGRITVIDDWKIGAPRTKDAATIVRRCRLDGIVLIVVGYDEIDVALSFRNLPQVQTTTLAELSAHDVIRADWLVFSEHSLPTSAGVFAGTHVDKGHSPEPTKVDRSAREEEQKEAKAAKSRLRARKADSAKSAEPAEAETAEDEAPSPSPSPAKKARATRKAKAAAADAEQALEAVEAEAEAELAPPDEVETTTDEVEPVTDEADAEADADVTDEEDDTDA
jgi:large subunit ribosomal protein L4